MIRKLILIACLIAAATTMPASAQTCLRPVTSAYSIEAGSAHLSDTYLTPLHYTGWRVAFDYERFQAMRFAPKEWIMRLNINAGYDETHNPARNATMRSVDIRGSWSMMRRLTIDGAEGLRIAAGGETTLEPGVAYLSRNGNNPVSVKAAWTVGLTAMVTYNMTVGRVPVTLRYQPSLPLLGAFFSPDYGELYYEISLGNRAGLAHCAWPGNRFVMDNLVTADLRLGATALRIGYSGRILSGKVNNIVTREFTHCVTVGVAMEWLPLNRSGRLPDADTEIISAYY